MSDIVRKYDYDRFLATLFCGERHNKDIFKFLEFNTEIALIKSKVSDPVLGEIRLKWWDEQIECIYSGKKIEDNNLAVLQLQEIIDKYQIDKGNILNITLARASDLSNSPFKTKDELYAYVYNTSFLPLKIMSKITRVDEIINKNSDIFAFLAKKWGISAIFRAAIKNIIKGRSVLPVDLTEKFALKPDRIKQESFKKAFVNICNDILLDIKNEETEIKKKYSKKELKIFAETNPHFFVLNKIADIYFKKFEKTDYKNLIEMQNIPLNFIDLAKISAGYKKF